MSPNSVPARRPLVPILAACAAAGLLAGASWPLVPLALERQGVDKASIGVIAAAWGIGMLLTATRIPRLAARYGTVPLMVGAVVVGAAVSVAYTFTSSPIVWFALNLTHGAVDGVPWVLSEIWINMVVEERHRSRAMAIYAILIAAGMALGPFVLQAVGVYGPLPFLTCALIALLIALPLLPYWKSAPAIAPQAGSGFVAVVLAAPLAMLAAFSTGVGEQVAFSFLPVYAVGAGVAPKTGALWLSAFVVGNLVLQWPIGWLADRVDRRAVLAGATMASAALVLLLTLAPAHSPIVLVIVLLWGGISFGIYPLGLALLGRRFRHGDIARANTVFSMLYIGGGLVGQPLTGAAMDQFGDVGLGWTLAFFYVVAATGALLALRGSEGDRHVVE
ncbi:MFS transporter [Enhydrobacter sp.]|uniref:MFS transporter n=1 Tax=Enhydrobacter sp. TaxID=1894999 RepID=UPI00261395E5|nr:MFS transporter [Enhydrobacter sp.]WIM11839.1 MAG: putative MFS-type transporter [Enhydrobacter sp.]